MLHTQSSGLVLELSVPAYDLRTKTIADTEYQLIDFPGAAFSSEPGSLQLPEMSALIGVPPNAEVVLRILIDERVTETIPLHFPPVPIPEPLDEDLQPGKWLYEENTEIYSRDGLIPKEVVQIGDEAWLRDQRMVRLDFHPFQYLPKSGNLIWHKKLRVEVRFIQSDEAVSYQRLDQIVNSPFESVLRQQLINYDQARQWRAISRAENAPQPTMLRPEDTDTLYRIPVDQDGIYKLRYNELFEAGIDVFNLDPTTFRLTNQGDEVAIYVYNSDGNAHTFSPGEYVLFYGQKFTGERMAARFSADDDLWLHFTTQRPDGAYTTWQPQMNAAMLEKYTDENIYWLSYGENPGVRMALIDGTPGEATIPAAFTETVRAEQSRVWKTTLFTSEDTWFWEKIVASGSVIRSYTTTLIAPVIDSTLANLRGEVVSEAYNDLANPDHHLTVYFNDANHSLPLVDATWDGKSRYYFETTLPQSSLVSGTNQLDLQMSSTAAVPVDTVYFDWFEVEFQRQFQVVNNQITFSSEQIGDLKYQVDGFSTWDLAVLDITQPLAPSMFNGWEYSTGMLTFQNYQSALTRYFLAAPQDVTSERIQAYTPADLSIPADYLIVTHADFLSGAQALADFHSAQGLTTRVIDVADLYNQFNDGIYNPIAIKRYLQYAFSTWSVPPSYVVLIGDGHWNFKGYPGYDNPANYMPPYLAWVDPWQGEVDSANLLATVVGNDPLPDVAIGRIPVNSMQELNRVIQKTLSYSQAPADDWHRRITFAADNTPDPAGDFVALTEAFIAEYIPLGWTVNRVYLDNFECSATPPYDCPQATDALIQLLNEKGTLLLNYSGHAGINFWASEQLMGNTDISSLSNGTHLPIILSLDCLDGYWSHPNLAVMSKSGPGLIEEIVRADQRGAVAAFSPTGLGVSTGHDVLQRGFYASLLQDGEWRLGPATIAAKVALYATHSNFDLIHTFTVFGDPALEIPQFFEIFMPVLRR